MTDRIDRLEQQVAMLTREVNQNVSGINTNATAIAQLPTSPEMRAGFNEVVQWLGNQTNILDAVQGDVGILKTGMDTLKTDMAAVKTRLTTVETKLDAVDNRLGRVETRLDGIDQGIQQILAALQQN